MTARSSTIWAMTILHPSVLMNCWIILRPPSPQDSLQYIHTYRANDKIVIGRKIYDMHHTSTPLGYIMLYIDESQLSRLHIY
mgnify:CR=1 FL=1